MDMNEFLTQLSIALIPVLVTGLTALLGVGVTYLSAMVKQKFGEQAQAKADVYLRMMQDAATGAVVAIQQSTVDRLKKEGKWNELTAEQVKRDAVAIALASLGDAKDKIAAQLLIDVPAHMSILVELALQALKAKASA